MHKCYCHFLSAILQKEQNSSHNPKQNSKVLLHILQLKKKDTYKCTLQRYQFS